MCIGYPGRVVAIGASGAIVDTNDRRRSFACDRLSARQLSGLITSTAQQLRIANETI